MIVKTNPITTMMGLLEALFVDKSDTRKKCACAWICLSDDIYVYQHFSGGPEHLNVSYCAAAHLDWDIFTDAINAKYMAGLQRGGYVSETEFQITVEGENELARLKAKAAAAERAKSDQFRSKIAG
jgi:hypothetical protein